MTRRRARAPIVTATGARVAHNRNINMTDELKASNSPARATAGINAAHQ